MSFSEARSLCFWSGEELGSSRTNVTYCRATRKRSICWREMDGSGGAYTGWTARSAAWRASSVRTSLTYSISRGACKFRGATSPTPTVTEVARRLNGTVSRAKVSRPDAINRAAWMMRTRREDTWVSITLSAHQEFGRGKRFIRPEKQNTGGLFLEQFSHRGTDHIVRSTACHPGHDDLHDLAHIGHRRCASLRDGIFHEHPQFPDGDSPGQISLEHGDLSL